MQSLYFWFEFPHTHMEVWSGQYTAYRDICERRFNGCYSYTKVMAGPQYKQPSPG